MCLIDVIQVMMYSGSHFEKATTPTTGQISRDPIAKNLSDNLF